MPNDVVYFRQQAERARAFADASLEPDIHATWAQLAKQFDYLADLSERYGLWRQDIDDLSASASRPLSRSS